MQQTSFIGLSVWFSHLRRKCDVRQWVLRQITSEPIDRSGITSMPLEDAPNPHYLPLRQSCGSMRQCEPSQILLDNQQTTRICITGNHTHTHTHTHIHVYPLHSLASACTICFNIKQTLHSGRSVYLWISYDSHNRQLLLTSAPLID
jgi:hypothetical protein